MVEKNKKENNKKSFSLLAVIMLLIIIAVVMMLSMPLITGRHQSATTGGESASGKYVCYRDSSGQLCEQSFSNGNPVSNLNCGVPGCTFRAPSNVEHVNIQLVGGGGGGSGIDQKGLGHQHVTHNSISYTTANLPASGSLEGSIRLDARSRNINNTLFNIINGGLFDSAGNYMYSNGARMPEMAIVRFTFKIYSILLYGGKGGSEGETASHLTTNLSNIEITNIGNGGRGGNCYRSGNYNYDDCAGEDGGDTVLNLGNSGAITAKGGAGGSDMTTEPYEPTIEVSNDNMKASPFSFLRGQRSGLHTDTIQAGDGGSGAGIRYKCNSNRLITQLEYKEPLNLFSTKRMTYVYIPQGSNCSGDINVNNDFSYIRYDNSEEYTDITDGFGYVGQDGQGGAVIITW